MPQHHLTQANAKIYQWLLGLVVVANWDGDQTKAGPYFGLLAENRDWRLYLCKVQPEARPNRLVLPVRAENGRLYLNTHKPSSGLGAAFHQLLVRLKKLGMGWYGSKVYLYHLTFALEGGTVPKGYERHHANFNSQDDRAANIVAVPKEDHAAFHADYPAQPKPLPPGFGAYLLVEGKGRAGWGVNGCKTVGSAYLAKQYGWVGDRPRKAARILALVAFAGAGGITIGELKAGAQAYGIGPKNAQKLVTMLHSGKPQMLSKLARGRYTLAKAALCRY